MRLSSSASSRITSVMKESSVSSQIVECWPFNHHNGSINEFNWMAKCGPFSLDKRRHIEDSLKISNNNRYFCFSKFKYIYSTLNWSRSRLLCFFFFFFTLLPNLTAYCGSKNQVNPGSDRLVHPQPMIVSSVIMPTSQNLFLNWGFIGF